MHAFQIEERSEFLHAHDLLIGAGIPAQQRQHIDERFRVVPLLAIAAALLLGRWVEPIQREHREAEAIAVALAQLAVAIGLKDQR